MIKGKHGTKDYKSNAICMIYSYKTDSPTKENEKVELRKND